MRVALVVLAALLAGCLEPPPEPQLRSVGWGQAAGRAYELGGLNVSFNGTLDLTIPVDVPTNASVLVLSWWAVNLTAGDLSSQAISLPGCPTKIGGHAVSGGDWNVWCFDPPLGPQQVHWRASGSLRGRICVVALPAGADEQDEAYVQCQGFPYFFMCDRDPHIGFCQGRNSNSTQPSSST